MTFRSRGSENTGPIGPVAVSAAILLLIGAPLMRGGNRHVALIGLEVISILFLLSVWIRVVLGKAAPQQRFKLGHTALLSVLLLSPAWLALVYLAPLPSQLLAALPGRDLYPQLVVAAGIPAASRTLSLVPDATMASLLAGIPLIAAFLGGYLCRLDQLKLLLTCVVGIALFQVLLGLLQLAGGPQSALYVGEATYRPVGTFANPNHFANYIAMATAAYVWLSWNSLVAHHPPRPDAAARHPAGRHTHALWVAGGIFLVLGVLISRSRGAAFAGLLAAMLSVGVVVLTGGRRLTWRVTLGLVAAVVAAAVSFIGLDSFLSRFDPETMSSSALGRALLASTTLEGAASLWPWGAGWGSFAAVYPRFQSSAIAGYVDHAHHDYAQMLFEGGVFAVILWGVFLFLTGMRAVRLTQSLPRKGTFNSSEMASALCGLGLLGFLLHSLVEFNMHIPANAILAALLAGVYFRPSAPEECQR